MTLYGLIEGEGVAWRASEVHANALGGVDFKALHHDRLLGHVRLQVPGTHNALNAVAALAVAGHLGVPFEVAAEALTQFSGTARRFEIMGTASGVTVIDDYAHHPTQIRAVLVAARERYVGGHIVAVWQPHTFSRVRALWEDFITAFSGADRVVVLPVYAAREVDDGSFDQNTLASALAHSAVTSADSLEDAVRQLEVSVQPGDVVILMGAGDEYLIGERLLTRLGKEMGTCHD